MRAREAAFAFAFGLAPETRFTLVYWLTPGRCAEPSDRGWPFETPEGHEATFTTGSDGRVGPFEVAVPARPGNYCMAAVLDGQLRSWTRHFTIVPRWMGTNLAVGQNHWLLVQADTTAATWGANTFGQLGTGNITDRQDAVAVGGLSGVVAVAAGADHSLALCDNGTLLAWGRNHRGQLGDPETSVDRVFPVQPLAVDAAAAMAGGGAHTLVVAPGGSVWAFGDNRSGQLGRPPTEPLSETRSLVPDIDGVEQVAAGEAFSLVLDWQGRVWAWGDNHFGQLGDGTTDNHHIPVPVVGLPVVRAIAAGDRHAVAVDENGGVWAWGDNTHGQSGTNLDDQAVGRPRAVGGLREAVNVAAGAWHSAALLASGAVWAWGANDQRQLSNDTPPRQSSPVPVLGSDGPLADVYALAAGGNWSVAARTTGRVAGWGRVPG